MIQEYGKGVIFVSEPDSAHPVGMAVYGGGAVSGGFGREEVSWTSRINRASLQHTYTTLEAEDLREIWGLLMRCGVNGEDIYVPSWVSQWEIYSISEGSVTLNGKVPQTLGGVFLYSRDGGFTIVPITEDSYTYEGGRTTLITSDLDHPSEAMCGGIYRVCTPDSVTISSKDDIGRVSINWEEVAEGDPPLFLTTEAPLDPGEADPILPGGGGGGGGGGSGGGGGDNYGETAPDGFEEETMPPTYYKIRWNNHPDPDYTAPGYKLPQRIVEDSVVENSSFIYWTQSFDVTHVWKNLTPVVGFSNVNHNLIASDGETNMYRIYSFHQLPTRDIYIKARHNLRFVYLKSNGKAYVTYNPADEPFQEWRDGNPFLEGSTVEYMGNQTTSPWGEVRLYSVVSVGGRDHPRIPIEDVGGSLIWADDYRNPVDPSVLNGSYVYSTSGAKSLPDFPHYYPSDRPEILQEALSSPGITMLGANISGWGYRKLPPLNTPDPSQISWSEAGVQFYPRFDWGAYTGSGGGVAVFSYTLRDYLNGKATGYDYIYNQGWVNPPDPSYTVLGEVPRDGDPSVSYPTNLDWWNFTGTQASPAPIMGGKYALLGKLTVPASVIAHSKSLGAVIEPAETSKEIDLGYGWKF